MWEVPTRVLQAKSSPETGACHLPVTLKGFAVLGSSVELRDSCQFSFTCTVLLGKLFVACPFPVKHLWGLVVFPLDQFPPGLSGSDMDCCSRCKPLQVLWELALSPKEIIFSPPSEVNIRVTSDRMKDLAQVNERMFPRIFSLSPLNFLFSLRCIFIFSFVFLSYPHWRKLSACFHCGPS